MALVTTRNLLVTGSNDSPSFHPLHPNIRMHILHTALYTFPKMMTGRICFNNQELLQLVIISFLLMTLMFDSGSIMWGETKWSSFLRVSADSMKADYRRCLSAYKTSYRRPFSLLDGSCVCVFFNNYEIPVLKRMGGCDVAVSSNDWM